jgi:hypothetical protein
MNDIWTVKELIDHLSELDGNLPVNIHIIEKADDNSEDGLILPLEAAANDGESVGLVCYNTQINY